MSTVWVWTNKYGPALGTAGHLPWRTDTAVVLPRVSWVSGHVQQHLTPASTLGGIRLQIFGERWCKDFAGAWAGQMAEEERSGSDTCAIKVIGIGHKHWLAVDEVA